jgi:hypothetical protein
MNDALHALDVKELMELASFRRFLWRSIQSAGIFEPATNGADGRNLDWIEGRRCLGFDILRDVERGQPVQHPQALLTLLQVLREEAQSQKPEKPNGRRDRYHDDSDSDDTRS